ncbi:alpha/beta hydrolase family protein [Nocardia sp. NPDC050712]|uniref:alpha/beta hydrolase n=1 Tax=Nocardia sp. NPDC050712 TaxID=3155518 RepID=UPI0033E48CFF
MSSPIADRTPRVSRWPGAVLGVCLALACAATPVVAQPPSFATAPDAAIIAEQWVTTRTVRITVSTNAFTGPVAVEVTLPVEYRSADSRRWPVTYYLAGANHDQTAFRAAYNGEAVTAAYPSIVVAPRGDVGFWSDWFNDGADGPPKYETFVIDQLIPLIDKNFRTLPERGQRAVMGESMGGYGALMLSARHPDEFVAAASLSGVLDTNSPATWEPISQVPLVRGARPDAVYGPRATQEIRWRGHNPVDLAGNLGATDLQLFTGNGVFDPAHGETPAEAALGCPVEAAIVQQPSLSMHRELLARGIPHRWVELPWGCHGPAMFEHQMREAVQRLTEVFADPPAPPATFGFRSIEPSFEVWGWSVRADPNRAVEFLDLREVGVDELTITGSGITTLTTPPGFRGAGQVTGTIDGNPVTFVPDASGRITLTIDLGPPNQHQQFRAGALSNVTTSVLRLSR